MNCKQVVRSVVVVLFTYILMTSMAGSVGAAQPQIKNLNIVSVDSSPLFIDKLVYTALKEINYQATITATISLQSAYELADNHNRDGVISSAPNMTKLFTHLRQVPVAIEDTNVYVFARSGKNIEINSWEDFSDFKVGMLPQRVYFLSKVPANTKVVQKETTKLLFEGLENGECDVVVLAVRAHETFNLPKEAVRVGSLETLKEYLYLHESLEYLIPDIADALKKLEEDGRKEKILSSVRMPKIYPGQTILHINSYNSEISREDQFNKALKKYFPTSLSKSVEWYSISLNSRRFLGDSSRLTYFSGILRRDIVSRDVAAIVVSGEEAMEFLKDYYFLFFKDVPVLFYGITDIYKTLIPPGCERFFTGVVETLPAYETVSVARELFPQAKNLFVINDYTPEGRAYNRIFENQLSPFAGELNIEYNENTSYKTLVERIKGLPKDSIVLIGSYFCDSNGQYYAQDEMKRTLESECPAPVFALYSATLAYGPLGGKFLDYQKYAEVIAGMLKQLLNGENIASIPIVADTSGYNRWIFDENMMKKWSVREQSLPKGTEIINKAPTVWEANPALMAGIVVFSVASLIVIAILMLFTKKLREKNTQLQRAEELKAAHRSLQTVLNAMPVPVRILDLETESIVYMNKSCMELLEIDVEADISNLSGRDILPEYTSDGTPSYEKIEMVKSTKKAFSIDVEYLTAKGNIIDSLLTACHIEYKGRKSSVGIIRDLSQERREAELRSTAIAAEKESRAKTMFLANMSHEIRTPMNGIIGMTDLLMGESLSERQSQYVKDIKISAESLLGIINDILDLSKINEGMLHIMPVDIDLSTLLKNVVSMLGFAARSKNLDFIDDIQINMPEYVRVDDVRLNQIIVNLLSNAIKFTKKGHVKLLVKIEGGNIVIEVSDTGIGILPDDLPLIFMPFEQADKRKNRAIKGTGLGLSVTKNLVELMEGQIWAESEYGVGTVFYVTLPYVPGDESAVVVVDTEFRYIFAPTAQILLVDDIQTNLTVGAGLLRLCGITADVAMSGPEAIELVKAKDYDIVFMDHMMPEMDGIEAMKLIRGLGGKYCSLPIIALTANAVNESKELLLSSGMDDFLSKPIDKALMMNILQRWLPADKIEAATKPSCLERDVPYSAVLEAASKIEGLDIELALSRIGGMQDVLESSLKQTAFAIEGQLRKMDEFLSDGNLPGFAIEAHGLKGAFSNIGATHHSELSAELEIASKAENMPLCAKKFTVFADVMQVFANELKSIFPQSADESRPQGEKDFLELKISEAIEYLNSFEAGDALDCLNALSNFTFGAETDREITEAKAAAEAFNYEKAVSHLKNI